MMLDIVIRPSCMPDFSRNTGPAGMTEWHHANRPVASGSDPSWNATLMTRIPYQTDNGADFSS
jgi:hypothetical protein